MSKKSKKKARKAAKRAANKNAILKKDKQTKPAPAPEPTINTVEQGTGSALLNFTTQTDNTQTNFKDIKPSKPKKKNAKPAKTINKPRTESHTHSALKELWDSLDVEELKKLNKKTKEQKTKPTAPLKLTKKEIHLQAEKFTDHFLCTAGDYIIENELKPNTNPIQIRKDLDLMQKKFKKKTATIQTYRTAYQLLCDILFMMQQANKQKNDMANRMFYPSFYAMILNFFERSGQLDTKKL